VAGEGGAGVHDDALQLVLIVRRRPPLQGLRWARVLQCIQCMVMMIMLIQCSMPPLQGALSDSQTAKEEGTEQ